MTAGRPDVIDLSFLRAFGRHPIISMDSRLRGPRTFLPDQAPRFDEHMKKCSILLTLSLNLLYPAFSAARAADPGVPPAAAGAGELRDIRDRLAVNLFARGELADAIIEAGLQNSLVKLTGREAYPDVRHALIGWITNNPDEAARTFYYLKDRRSGEAGPSVAVSYQMPSWKINPRFLELLRGVNSAAKNAAISDEEMSLAVHRLFEGEQARPEAGAPAGPAASVPGPAGRGAAISYADYRLDPARAERESRTLAVWFERVKAALEEAGPDAENENAYALRRRCFEETFSAYRSFALALSGLKGRNRITGEEAAGLEGLRRSLRKNLGVMDALFVMSRIDKEVRALPARSPGAEFLRTDAFRIKEALNAFLADLRANPESASYAALRLHELKKAFDFWNLRFIAHGRLSDLKNRMTGRGFSCVLDKLVFQYLSRFRPSAAYARLAAESAGRAAAVDAALDGVAAGDYEGAVLFAGGEKQPLAARILEAESEAARLEYYSGFNRRLQFFFWDVFVNPFGLAPGPNGASSGNKLLF